MPEQRQSSDDIAATIEDDIEFPSSLPSDGIEYLQNEIADISLDDDKISLTETELTNETTEVSETAETLEIIDSVQIETTEERIVENESIQVGIEKTEQTSNSQRDKLFVRSFLVNFNLLLVADVKVMEIQGERSEMIAELEKSSVPSAPTIDELEVPKQELKPTAAMQSVQYPNLSEFQRQQTKTFARQNEQQKQRTILRPYTKKELDSLYRNPELEQAEVLETAFISYELSFAYREHPLYELLRKYAQSNYNIRLNNIDWQGYKNAFKTSLNDVWTIEKRSMSYRGVCADNVSVEKSLNYE